MAEDLRQNPAIQAELDVIAMLESSRGKQLRPSNPEELSFGTYHLNAMGLVDAVNNGVSVPAKVKEIVGDWNGKSTSDRYQVQHDLFQWMTQNPQDTDRVAEQYYTAVVRPRAKNVGPAAIMYWQSPGATQKDLSTLGIDPSDLDKDPKALNRFLDHVETSGQHDRASRARSLRESLPLLDYTKTIKPPDPKTLPMTPKGPIKQFDPRVPYPTTEVTDPWMQHGHAVAYQESIKDYGDILGTETMAAATRLQAKIDMDPQSRRLLSRAYAQEGVTEADSPVDTALDFGVAPYGLARATADVVHAQFQGDQDFIDRVKNGAIAAPLIIGGIFGHKFRNAAKTKTLGMTEAAAPEKVKEATDTYTKELASLKQVREGIEIRLKTVEAAGDEDATKLAKRELTQARRKEHFFETILDNDKGEAEIRRLEYWKQGLQEEGADLKKIQAVDKRIESAKARLQLAQDALRMPSSEAVKRSLEVWKNLEKSAHVPTQVNQAAAEALIRDGKVSLETIMARDIDAALNPIAAQAEAILANNVSRYIDDAATVYKKSDGSIIAAHQMVAALSMGAAVLGKVRRSDVRLGQAVKALEGKSHDLRALSGMVEGLDVHSLPAFTQIWKTASTDLDRVSQLRRLSNPGVFKGSVMQILTNNLISSPSTAFWNVVSMGAMTVSRMNELRLLGKLDPAHFAHDEAGTFGTALVGYYGKLLSGDVKARKAWDAQFQQASLRSGNIDPGVMEKYNFRQSISAASLGITGSWGGAVNTLGNMINLPTQFSAWADAMVSVGIKDAMAKTLAHRQAILELQAEQSLGLKITDQQVKTRLAAREQEILANENAMIMVDGKATLIRDLAAEDASVISMTGKLQSQSLGGVEKWMNNSLVARMIIPFPHPFLQTMEMALERTPIGRLLPHMKADLAAGGARAAAAKAKLATGNQTAAVMAMFAGLSYVADDSDWIGYTGSGPFKQSQKSLWAATHRADTIRIGGKEIMLAKLGPVGQVMSATADVMGVINEGINYGDKSFSDTALSLAAHISAAWTHLAVSELFAADVKDVIAGFVEGDASAFERVIERKGTMLVPAGAFVRDLTNILTETRQQLQTAVGPLKFVEPTNFWGDPTRYFGTQNPLATLIGLTERNAPDFDRKNKVAERLIADDVGVTAPGKHLSFGDVSVELSLEQMYAMREYFAKAHLPGSGVVKAGDLLTGLESIVASPLYAKLVNGRGENADQQTRFGAGSKQDMVNMYVSKRKEAAKAWLVGKSQWGQEIQERVALTKQAREYDLKNPQGVPPTANPGAGSSRTSPMTLGGVQ